MAEITRRRVGRLQRGVIKILLDSPDGLPAKEVPNRLEPVAPTTEFAKSLGGIAWHSGRFSWEKMGNEKLWL